MSNKENYLRVQCCQDCEHWKCEINPSPGYSPFPPNWYCENGFEDWSSTTCNSFCQKDTDAPTITTTNAEKVLTIKLDPDAIVKNAMAMRHKPAPKGKMPIELYNEIINDQIDKCKSMICSKRAEYATDQTPTDNFNRAAMLLKQKPTTGLAGVMAKHTISIYDMLYDHERGAEFSKEKWDEKITDSINYLLLLQVLLEEERRNA